MSKASKAKVEAENKVVMGIKSLLEKLDIKDEDFRKGRVHSIVVNAIEDEWERTNGFGEGRGKGVPKRLKLGIDVLKRTFTYGPIILAVEVDRGRRPYESWAKLMDVRSKYRIWIHVSNRVEAKTDFEESLKELKRILSDREESKETMGNFVAFLKTPNFVHFETLL